jgi:hypothetical protein
MRKRRVFKKDEALSLRLPRADKERLETAARTERRNPSDLAWVLICEGLDRLHQRQPEQQVAYAQ